MSGSCSPSPGGSWSSGVARISTNGRFTRSTGIASAAPSPSTPVNPHRSCPETIPSIPCLPGTASLGSSSARRSTWPTSASLRPGVRSPRGCSRAATAVRRGSAATPCDRRRCRQIYCFDASGDRPDTFGTLAEAMRLAREELNAEIAIDPTPMKPDPNGVSPIGVEAATIRYAEELAPSGWIVVAKLAVPKTAPFDIIDLARTLPSFPNNPTADQLYTDPKFEAYRALGHHLGERAFALADSIRARIADGDSIIDAVAYANTHQ